MSWKSEETGKFERVWRDVADPDAEESKAVPTNSLTGRISSWLGQRFLPTNFPHSVHKS